MNKIINILSICLVLSIIYHCSYYTYLIDSYKKEEIEQLNRIIDFKHKAFIDNILGWKKFVENIEGK